MTHRYTTWTIKFTDGNEFNASTINADGIGLVQVQLSAAFHHMNREDGDKNGMIDTDSIFLINKEATYEYIVFFKLHGDNPQGYNKQMFQQTTNPMKGKR